VNTSVSAACGVAHPATSASTHLCCTEVASISPAVRGRMCRYRRTEATIQVPPHGAFDTTSGLSRTLICSFRSVVCVIWMSRVSP